MSNTIHKAMVMTAAMAVALSLPFASSGNESQAPGLWGLDDRFAAYEIKVMAPAIMKTELDSGAMELELLDEVYPILVAPVPWQAHLDAIDEETGEITSPGWTTAAYRGTVDGLDGARVLVVLTEAGAYGYVQKETARIGFEPVSALDPVAPPGVSAVYRQHDVLVPEGLGHDDHISAAFEGIDPDLPIGEGNPTTDSHAPDRSMTLWRDSVMNNDVPNWNSRVTNAWNALNDEYEEHLEFHFSLTTGSIRGCSTASCDSSFGMNSNGPSQLPGWANAVKSYSPISGFEIAALFTGRDIHNSDGDNIWGSAWQPGRYSRTQGNEDLTQEQVSSTTAHEVGHNFAGDHSPPANCPSPGGGTGTYGRAECYDHWHEDLVFYCSTPPHFVYQVTGVCLSGANQDEGSWHKHYTLMWSGESGNRDYAPSSDNWLSMSNCAGGHWTPGTYNPGFISGFGTWCTT